MVVDRAADSAMALSIKDAVPKILIRFEDAKVSKIILTGPPGAGKSWVAREVCDSATKEGSSFGSIWISSAKHPEKNRLLEKNDMLDIIASQLSLLPFPEEWVDYDDGEDVMHNQEDKETTTLKQRILDKLDTMRARKNKGREMEEKRSEDGGRRGKSRYLVMVLDGITKEDEDQIENQLKRILPLKNNLKMLITRKESKVTEQITAESEEISLKPLETAEAEDLFRGRVKAEVSRNQNFQNVAEKARGLLPATIILMAEALNNIGQRDGEQALADAMEKAAELKRDDAIGILRFIYKLMPKGVTRDCYWLSRQLFTHRDAVHFNELITYWILEGCFDQQSRIEKAYEEGHRVLMELMNRGMLKGGRGDHVYLERAMLDLPDERRNGFSGAAKLRLVDVMPEGLGRITLADGMIRTVCRDKEKKEMSTLIIDGARLSKEVPEEFFKSVKRLKVLAVFNPMFENLPPGLTGLEDLEVLILRGCRHLKEVDGISTLTKLSVLEISDASSLESIAKDIFKNMPSLKSVNLSGVNAEDIPDSVFDRGEVRFLILRKCPRVTKVPLLKEMKKLEMIDICGCKEIKNFVSGDLKELKELTTLSVSGTKVQKLPFLSNAVQLKRILVRKCPELTMIPSLGENVEVLDLCGAKSIKDVNRAALPKKHRLRILDLSESGITNLPGGIRNVSRLNLRGCSNLQNLPSTKGLDKLVSLDLSGSVELYKIKDESLEHLKLLRRLNLSKTKIERLPTLTHLVELRELILRDCKNLAELHGLTALEKLKVLDLSGCSSLAISQEESFNHMPHLKKLDLSATKIEALPEECFPSSLIHLTLRDCNNLKQLPSLASLSKLEKLDLCGAKSLSNTKADFLSHIEELQILNLSGITINELPSLSHLKKLKELYLSSCPCVPSGLDQLTELEVLDLSETKLESLPDLEKFTKLRKLFLRNCSALKTLTNLGSLSHLEVLDLSGTGTTHFPYEMKDLTRLQKLHLPSAHQIQFDWSKIKYLPADLKLDDCEPPPTATTSQINAAAPQGTQRAPSILVRGTEFFRFLEKNPLLWDTSFKRFHFSVRLDVKEPEDTSIFEYLNPIRRYPNTRGLSLLEIHGSSDFPSELNKAMRHAEYISVIDNDRISSISNLGKEFTSSMVSCWLERCPQLPSILVKEEEDIELFKKLDSLYLCNLPSLEHLCDPTLESGIFSSLTNLQLDCCPELIHLFSPSVLPKNLETLKVKSCNKLKTLFEGDGSGSAEFHSLKTLELFDLPELQKVGAATPALETLKARACWNLEHSGIFSTLKNLQLACCPKIVHIFSPSVLPKNLETLKVESCSKLETLFKEDGSALHEMPKLKTLELFDLPELKKLGATTPVFKMETLTPALCRNLQLPEAVDRANSGVSGS